jgi:hypothetical protein
MGPSNTGGRPGPRGGGRRGPCASAVAARRVIGEPRAARTPAIAPATGRSRRRIHRETCTAARSAAVATRATAVAQPRRRAAAVRPRVPFLSVNRSRSTARQTDERLDTLPSASRSSASVRFCHAGLRTGCQRSRRSQRRGEPLLGECLQADQQRIAGAVRERRIGRPIVGRRSEREDLQSCCCVSPGKPMNDRAAAPRRRCPMVRKRRRVEQNASPSCDL